ncbi:hypothetical protein SEVIR_6G180700v4 [Setaria viridis]|uniref:Uncharacterized protein n=1 Tax=Setaria viridis TaxID=4556 RepID=A0A4U6U4V0_SETVI|nr:hypothetical protein SEVIR_6G180700v2 [Setaria viridis]
MGRGERHTLARKKQQHREERFGKEYLFTGSRVVTAASYPPLERTRLAWNDQILRSTRCSFFHPMNQAHKLFRLPKTSKVKDAASTDAALARYRLPIAPSGA